jgi:hypothetical protein
LISGQTHAQAGERDNHGRFVKGSAAGCEERRHAIFNPSREQIEELKRDAAAFRADPEAWHASNRKH